MQGQDFWRHAVRRTAGAAVAAAMSLSAAAAQDGYPNHPVVLSHGFGAGGNSDTVARVIAPILSERLGQQVIVEPRTGAGGNLASDRAAKASPDGYTLIVLTGGHAVSGALYKALPFDPVKDFQFISTLIYFPLVISVRADSRFKNLGELLAEAKEKPGTITFSSVGVGSTQHLAGELLSSMAGVKLVHVPYRGGTGPLTDLLGGQIDVMIDSLTVTSTQIASGALRGLAVTSPQAWPSLPGIPPVANYAPGYDVRSWMGVATAKNTPQPIVDRLNREIRYALQQPAAKGRLEQIGNEVRASSPDEMRDHVAAEVAKWANVIADANVPRQ